MRVVFVLFSDRNGAFARCVYIKRFDRHVSGVSGSLDLIKVIGVKIGNIQASRHIFKLLVFDRLADRFFAVCHCRILLSDNKLGSDIIRRHCHFPSVFGSSCFAHIRRPPIRS